MKTRYPIKYKNGRLVKHLKPIKYIKKYNEYSMGLYEDQKLDDLIRWVEEFGGDVKDAILRHEYGGYGDDGHMELYLKIDLSEKEIADQEKEYEKQLEEWKEWRELSKEAVELEKIKTKETRAKSLKTQEINLLKKLEIIRKQQEKI
jgi:hypothetical protein